MTDLPPRLSELLDEQGVDATRGHRVLAALSDGRWWSGRELVRATAVANRVMDGVLDALGDELERDDERVRLRAPGGYAAFDRPRPADPVGHLLHARPEAAAELERLVAEAPRSRLDLDHVAATADTALRRAVFLATRFELSGARLLCVGDHDLTSLAAGLVRPGTEADVVDVDERMLAYIDSAAARLGLRVRCHFADLRLGLPAAVRGRADLVFTDPPYTPEGVELFVRRGLEGLADPRRGRVLLAYGASETTPALTVKTQERLTRLGLATEAIWPDFNRYLGAEAIGAASDLYVLRGTTRTPAGGSGRDAARIYSRGANAKESRGALDAATAGALPDLAAADTVVGDWPSGAVPEGARRVRTVTWLAAPTAAQDAVINLTGGWEALLSRSILASSAARVRVVVPAGTPEVRDAAGQRNLREIVAPRYELRFLNGSPDARRCVVAARRVDLPDDADPVTRLLWHCRDRAHGTVASVLREGLIRVAADIGHPVNKKQARTRIAAAAPWLSGHTLLDLPRHRLKELDHAVAALVADLNAPTP
ncbi:hypothetical protein HDA32_003655 [Spinactinospora alkalitolerans]|uniref:N(4)-bis(aminopropyl)spermidine synthase C-terminal domain-containing protein n=1 Tax=Spinactinospora alkalitolerans TaxID=687207 RepID=A0A852TYW3_9ACTN|nr:bis-aminopropyl spermidine synthase family protein [Spinactinospora alkalitolerans]NYE48535.1 hypothetical protein [Spinactinospora alkalitolerans]